MECQTIITHSAKVSSSCWHSTLQASRRYGDPFYFFKLLLAKQHSCRYFLVQFNKLKYTKMSEYKQYMCVICGYVYDEATGWPDDNIASGTKWADIPEDWKCPDCDATKADFEMIEV